MPELDLVEDILNAGGVLQLETSRGCTHACSFCPKAHKGIWHGDTTVAIESILRAVSPLYDQRLHLARRVFLVDEEFIGVASEYSVVDRAKSIAEILHQYGFSWEANSRIDQVHRMGQHAWNQERAIFWAVLRDKGLKRCLFGVESGVDTILTRFKKKTTKAQNIAALRTLTAIGIHIGCTYITFDPLMTMDELRETYEFLGRRDLILCQCQHVSPAEIADRSLEDSWARSQASGRPFYTYVSYMMVSMECLIGSPYLQLVEEQGLATELVSSMGKRDARFLDERIGKISKWAQRWVDLNFSLDYLLKSLEKITSGFEKEEIRKVRYILRDHSYILLGRMIASADGSEKCRSEVFFEGLLNNVFFGLVVAIDDVILSLESFQPIHFQRLTHAIAEWCQREL